MKQASKSTRKIDYIDADMQMERVSLRISRTQKEWVRKLAEILQMDEAHVMRSGITLLAQLYGLTKAPSTLELAAKMERVLGALEAITRAQGKGDL